MDPISSSENRARRRSGFANMLIWAAIALITALIAGWTLWASHQPEFRSIWAPD
jgi:hypothetical protein